MHECLCFDVSEYPPGSPTGSRGLGIWGFLAGSGVFFVLRAQKAQEVPRGGAEDLRESGPVHSYDWRAARRVGCADVRSWIAFLCQTCALNRKYDSAKPQPRI